VTFTCELQHTAAMDMLFLTLFQTQMVFPACIGFEKWCVLMLKRKENTGSSTQCFIKKKEFDNVYGY
jgi:hypothetical protein